MQRVLGTLRRQWRAVLVGAGLLGLLSLPAVVDAMPVDGSGLGAHELTARILDSEDQPYHGYVVGQGGLRLPELPGAADLSTLVAGTARIRVWYQSPDAWRTDLLYSGGERDRYGTPDGTWIWDSGTHQAILVPGATQLRLPTPIDLTPPALARRLLEAAEPEEITTIAARRVAGRTGDGLRITPATSASTIGHIDLWADPASGLPLRLEITARGRDNPSIETGFLDLDVEPPDPALVTFEPPAEAMTRRGATEGLDLVQAIELYSETKLPDSLAGLPRRTEVATAAATYGEGFDVVGVLALSQTLVSDTLRALPTSERSWGRTVALVRTSLVNGMIFVVDGIAYIVGGPVTLEELDRVSADLLAQVAS